MCPCWVVVIVVGHDGVDQFVQASHISLVQGHTFYRSKDAAIVNTVDSLYAGTLTLGECGDLYL